MKHLLQSRYYPFLTSTINQPTQIHFEDSLTHDNYPTARTRLRNYAITQTIENQANNRILLAPPPAIDHSETLLPRAHRATLSQLRSGHCYHLNSYKHRINPAIADTCPDCLTTEHTAPHIFNCPSHPTQLSTADLWTKPLEAATFISALPSFSSLPALPFVGQPAPP